MNNKNLDTVRELRGFLIRKFIFTIILSSIAEYLVVSIVNHTFLPLIVHTIFKDATDVDSLRTSTLLFSGIMILVSLIINLFTLILPNSMKIPFQGLLDYLNINISDSFGLSKNAQLFSELSAGGKFFLIFLMIIILFLIISPYLYGCYYFVKQVIKRFNILEAEVIETQKSYERRRNLMLSDIAHDLKTPMTTVSGYAKALEDGMVKEDDKQKYLSAIQTKSKRMNDLIILLFDYIKLDSEGFTLMRTKNDICELTRECAAFLYQDIEDAGMELDIDIPEEQIILNIDKIQMTRSINNLLTNAVKHNKAGTKIKLTVVEEEGFCQIAVADSGEAIPADQVEHIFEPFVMGDESRNSRGGSGLGLSIVHKVMTMHGYRLRLVQSPKINKFHYLDGYNKAFIISVDLNKDLKADVKKEPDKKTAV